MIKYLSVEEVLFIHENISDFFGKTPRLLNQALLESSLHHIQDSRYYKRLSDKAAHLMFSIIMNHSFFDGNKRTAILTTMTFLERNDYVCEDDLLQFFMAMALRIASSRMKEPQVKKLFALYLSNK